MKFRIIHILCVNIFLCFFLTDVEACICVRDEIASHGFRGEIFNVYGAKEEKRDSIKNASIELRKETNKGIKVVAAVISNDEGKFEIKGVRPGKYILYVKAEHFLSVSTRIKILKLKPQFKDKISIRIEVGIDCCIGEISVQRG